MENNLPVPGEQGWQYVGTNFVDDVDIVAGPFNSSDEFCKSTGYWPEGYAGSECLFRIVGPAGVKAWAVRSKLARKPQQKDNQAADGEFQLLLQIMLSPKEVNA